MSRGFTDELYSLAIAGEADAAATLLEVLAHALRTRSTARDRRIAADLLEYAVTEASERDMRRVLGLKSKGRPTQRGRQDAIRQAVMVRIDAGMTKAAAITRLAKDSRIPAATIRRAFDQAEARLAAELEQIAASMD